MGNLTFERITQENLPELQSWFSDEVLDGFISKPDQAWMDYVTTTANVAAWLVSSGEQTIGQVQIDFVGQIGYMSYYVNPAMRNQGYGKLILTAVPTLQEVAGCKKLAGSVDEGNWASRKCLEASGFQNVGPDPEEPGMLCYERLLAG
ncbi:MAG: GNAT family N-acetyltransferase [Caldilineaceae bacterium]